MQVRLSFGHIGGKILAVEPEADAPLPNASPPHQPVPFDDLHSPRSWPDLLFDVTVESENLPSSKLSCNRHTRSVPICRHPKISRSGCYSCSLRPPIHLLYTCDTGLITLRMPTLSMADHACRTGHYDKLRRLRSPARLPRQPDGLASHRPR
ncbi:uncharacterized protein MYCFIDRAFT_212078 [Pseudocercospora fijiensis CIRAD86]|uniref:Uncharacterized protein n=1 Tax=Pseudocercospora fijiensis (strain CIRAD86) TaxID=383855 RepID=M2ZN63_PSEFD|nr:uncharacterized protein MYCFIDRAFT_212078 [Pseudocercospora fijiensis CIRAD86]EME80544.1 hypothetical protein MYCFIDRAFT_212078 [Pseudocercospora fijiensis CIRAD86]